MKITLNGTPQETGADTLAALLDETGYTMHASPRRSTKSSFPPAVRSEHRLNDGDRIEIVTPRQGG